MWRKPAQPEPRWSLSPLPSAAVLLLFGMAVSAGAADLADGEEIADRFRRLTRASSWRMLDEVNLAFPTYHPQGMTIVGSRFFLASVEVLNREEGRGTGHLFEVDFRGKLLRQIQLGDGPKYHPGGIDFDGRWIWVPVAEYRPASHSTVYRVDPDTLESSRVLDLDDHLGALVCERKARQLVGVSWGSRRFYQWALRDNGLPAEPDKPVEATNGSFYIDYQDGQSLPGTGLALFSGLSRLSTTHPATFLLGGLELVDLRELRAIHQLPMPLQTKSGRSLLQNPFAVKLGNAGLRFYFVPEDEKSTLYIFEIE